MIPALSLIRCEQGADVFMQARKLRKNLRLNPLLEMTKITEAMIDLCSHLFLLLGGEVELARDALGDSG